MAPATARNWVLAKKPAGLPVLSGEDATFQLVEKSLPALQEGQVLVKVQYLSNDPAQRQWIDPKIDPARLYTTPVEVGDTVAAYAAVAEVVESRSPALPVKTLVFGMTGWCDFAIIPADECIPIQAVDGLTATDCTALFGTAAVTAYYGLTDILQAGPKDAIVISGAAGAVGSVAVQIAKNMLKCKKVVGIAGSDEKCRWVESLGADVCLDYKSATFEAELIGATEGFVETFFDNVGGHTLDLMLTRLQKDGRVAACGAMADYNSTVPYGIKNWYQVIAMRLQVRGFVVLDAMPTGRWKRITDALVTGYLEGKLKATEQSLTIVPADMEDVPKAWMRLFEGQTSGKLLTQLL
jgi:NADPH-dependent curcumin reductase CurA